MLTTEHVKALLEHLVILKAKLKNYTTSIAYLQSEEAKRDEIQSNILVQNSEGMPYPPAGNNSDKTANIALSYQDKLNQELRAMLLYSHQIKTVIAQLEDAIESLPDKMQRLIVEQHYKLGKTMAQIADEYYKELDNRSARTISRMNGQAIEFIRQVITITERQYKDVLGRD